MDEIKKSSKENFLSKIQLKIIFAKNAFGGRYAEKKRNLKKTNFICVFGWGSGFFPALF